jgi:hypothetical protein
MAAGISTKLLDMSDVAAMLDDWERDHQNETEMVM